jgi:WD40 repeat protein
MFRKAECMAVSAGEDLVFIGTSTGHVAALDAKTLQLRSDIKANDGSIYGIALNPAGDLIATLGKDKRVSLVSWNGRALQLVGSYNTRTMRPANDEVAYEDVDSDSHAVAFHPTLDRLATHEASGGLVELDFTRTGSFTPLHCTRVCGADDVNSVRYVGDDVYSGSQGGLVVRSRGAEIIYSWHMANGGAAHWICDGPGDLLYVANDFGFVAEINRRRNDVHRHGLPFTRDDLECVDYNPVSGRLFAVSFDRNVYEVDITTMTAARVVFAARFKLKYCYSFRSAPDEMLILIRDGSLQRIDVRTGAVLEDFRETALAQWSIVAAEPGTFVIGGESDGIEIYRRSGAREFDAMPTFEAERMSLGMQPSYSKRIAWHRQSGTLLLARTDGRVYAWQAGQALAREVLRFDDAVRDIDVQPFATIAYACTEGGLLRKFDFTTGTTLAEFEEPEGRPLWALAYNALHDVIAVGALYGSTYLLGAEHLTQTATGPRASRIKRMKWISPTQMMMSASKWLEVVDWEKGEHRVLTDQIENTIEDFVYDPRSQTAVAISYTGDIALIDTAGRGLISRSPLDIDIAKGIIAAYDAEEQAEKPLDVLVVGRVGRPLVFRAFNDKLYGLGALEEARVATRA